MNFYAFTQDILITKTVIVVIAALTLSNNVFSASRFYVDMNETAGQELPLALRDYEMGTINPLKFVKRFRCTMDLSLERGLTDDRLIEILEEYTFKPNYVDISRVAEGYGWHSARYAIKHVTDEGIRQLAEMCPMLLGVDLQNSSITDKGVVALAERHPWLQELTIDGCNVTSEGMQSLAKNCPYLEVLSCFNCAGVTQADILQLASSCKWLRKVVLPGVNDDLTLLDMQLLFEEGARLTSLSLHGYSTINDELVEGIARYCPQLAELALGGNDSLTDRAIESVVQGCPSLHAITLDNCRGLTARSVRLLAEGCPQLTTVKLRFLDITDEDVIFLAQSCRRLREIDLTGCYEITSASLRALAANCPELEVITLGCPAVFSFKKFYKRIPLAMLYALKLNGIEVRYE